MRVLLLCVCGVLVSARLATAQCPDGTPPPCGRPATALRPPAPNSVAVLFFTSLSRDTADVFLADGLTDELITRLGQVQRLEVRSRFASERVRGERAADPRSMGRALGAAYLVTGTLQHVGQHIRVNAALVRTRDGTQAWGDAYDRAGEDVLTVQADIAREVASAITGRLLPQERATLARMPTRDPVAYALYLRGVGAANTTSEAGMRVGLDYLDQAIARDSGFAEAYVQRAVVWFMLADGYLEGRVGYPRVREDAERALRLDSSLATAWAMLANAVILDSGGVAAKGWAARALQLDPRSAWGHDALCFAWLAAPGGADSAVAEARRGWEADTLSALSAMPYLWVLSVLQRADPLAAVLPRMSAVLGPEDLRMLGGVVLLARHDPAGAAARLSWSYYGGMLAAEYVRAQLALGRTAVARAAVDSMVAVAARGYFNAVGIARAYAALGDADAAFAWLDRAWEQRTGWLMPLRLYTELAPLHADPRWAALLRRMGREP